MMDEEELRIKYRDAIIDQIEKELHPAESNLLMIKESFDKHDLNFLKNAYCNFKKCGARVMMALLEEGLLL